MTALRGQYCRGPVTASQKGGNSVTTFARHVSAAKYTVKWQSKMFYSHHTDGEYDLVEASISDMSDSDYDNIPCGNRREVHKVSGKYLQEDHEFEDVSKWILAMVTMVGKV